MECIIQARMSSKRFPGKVLKKIRGKEILTHVISNIKKSKEISKIIVATSNKKNDNLIEKYCIRNEILYYRGPLNNVTKRISNLLRQFKIKSFVRITADSPLIDHKLIDKAIRIFNKGNYDIVTNVFPRSFPIGQSVEVVKAKKLLEIKNKIKINRHKEHVTSFFYENSSKFKIYNIKNKTNFSDINLSINTKNDFKRINRMLKYINNNSLSLLKNIQVYKKILV
jgi:spore coat polysaccharide biosynthesis protein SpsF (cytidylyltransferase family)|tara:strand:+ start:3006 stop:3680 length:675 start_codon:yes stop_codon:yes gene_type:complete